MRNALCSLLGTTTLVFSLAVSSEAKGEDAFAQGKRAFEKNDCVLAVSYFTEAIRLNPKDATMYVARGLAHFKKGDPDKAITGCPEAIRLNPEFAEAYAVRGFALASRRETRKAEADFSDARRLGYSGQPAP